VVDGMTKAIYLKDGRVNLNNYHAKLLHKNETWAVILFKDEENMLNFLDDWCLDDDMILKENMGLFIITAPICLVQTAEQVERAIAAM
jgi:hypothetical protein